MNKEQIKKLVEAFDTCVKKEKELSEAIHSQFNVTRVGECCFLSEIKENILLTLASNDLIIKESIESFIFCEDAEDKIYRILLESQKSITRTNNCDTTDSRVNDNNSNYSPIDMFNDFCRQFDIEPLTRKRIMIRDLVNIITVLSNRIGVRCDDYIRTAFELMMNCSDLSNTINRVLSGSLDPKEVKDNILDGIIQIVTVHTYEIMKLLK